MRLRVFHVGASMWIVCLFVAEQSFTALVSQSFALVVFVCFLFWPCLIVILICVSLVANDAEIFLCLLLISYILWRNISYPFPTFSLYYLPFYYLVVVVQLLSYVWLFATPWTAACQASLSFTISRSLLRLMTIQSVMPSDHLILCHLAVMFPYVVPYQESSPLSNMWFTNFFSPLCGLCLHLMEWQAAQIFLNLMTSDLLFFSCVTCAFGIVCKKGSWFFNLKYLQLKECDLSQVVTFGGRALFQNNNNDSSNNKNLDFSGHFVL